MTTGAIEIFCGTTIVVAACAAKTVCVMYAARKDFELEKLRLTYKFERENRYQIERAEKLLNARGRDDLDDRQI